MVGSRFDLDAGRHTHPHHHTATSSMSYFCSVCLPRHSLREPFLSIFVTTDLAYPSISLTFTLRDPSRKNGPYGDVDLSPRTLWAHLLHHTLKAIFIAICRISAQLPYLIIASESNFCQYLSHFRSVC